MATINRITAIGLFAAGAAVGAAFALLNAPASGRQTRRQLRDSVASRMCCRKVAAKGEETTVDTLEPVHDRAEENREDVEFIGSLAG